MARGGVGEEGREKRRATTRVAPTRYEVDESREGDGIPPSREQGSGKDCPTATPITPILTFPHQGGRDKKEGKNGMTIEGGCDD